MSSSMREWLIKSLGFTQGVAERTLPAPAGPITITPNLDMIAICVEK